jgi:hypothetical protein
MTLSHALPDCLFILTSDLLCITQLSNQRELLAMLLQDAGLHRLEAVAIRTPRDDTLQPHHLRSTGEPHPADYAPDLRLSDIARLRTIELEQVPSVWHPRMNRLRLAAVCLASFLNGFSDAGAGAIIPYMEEWVLVQDIYRFE